MREKDFTLCAWLLILVISVHPVFSSGWKPIAPPEDYYMAKAKTCNSDCDVGNGYKYPFLEDPSGGQTAETQVKSTLLSSSAAFNQEKAFHQSNKKLDLEIFKPTEVSFFPSGGGKTLDSSLTTYQEILQQSPSSFFTFKTYGGPEKPTKTIYYGNLEVAKPKFTNDIKYYKPYKQTYKNDVKILKPSSFLDNEVNFYQSSKGNNLNEHCSLYKVSFRQDLYYQYIQYKVHMPELNEFTLCLWMRFHNHSHDHSLFSYSAKHHRQAIYMWVSNLNEPGLFNMKVLGQTIFRLNFPIKIYKWYHTCQSWNGNTGEWQVWVNSHRIGRGFHNLLVNHPIPGGGVAISGQEHRYFGKGFQEIPQFLKGTGGLEGEITMLQLYKIALTAGKAYNDHSHHHSHYTTTTTEPPEIPTDEPSTTTDHPLLENGQLKKHVNVLELAEALKKGQLDTPEPSFHQYFHKPLLHPYVSHITPLTLHGNTINFVGLPGHAIFKRNDDSKAEENQKSDTQAEEKIKNPERVKFISNVSDHVQIEKIKFSDRNKTEELDKDSVMAQPESFQIKVINITEETTGENKSDRYSYEDEDQSDEESKGHRIGKRLRRQSVLRLIGNRTKRITSVESRPVRYYGIKKRTSVGKNILRKAAENEEKEAQKRQVIFEEPYLSFGSMGFTSQDVYPAYGGIPSTGGFPYDHFSHFSQDFSEFHDGSDQNIDDSLLNNDNTDKKIKKEVELAEGEVRRIMELCSGCHVDPFRKVVVVSWRSTPKKIYSGALFLKAKSECQNF